jgi:hypothetical protein
MALRVIVMLGKKPCGFNHVGLKTTVLHLASVAELMQIFPYLSLLTPPGDQLLTITHTALSSGQVQKVLASRSAKSEDSIVAFEKPSPVQSGYLCAIF